MGSRTGKVRDPVFFVCAQRRAALHWVLHAFWLFCCLFSEWRDFKMLTARIEKI